MAIQEVIEVAPTGRGRRSHRAFGSRRSSCTLGLGCGPGVADRRVLAGRRPGISGRRVARWRLPPGSGVPSPDRRGADPAVAGRSDPRQSSVTGPNAALAPGIDGLLLIDKPAGITSHDAVDRVRRALGVRKVGHAGTLDPIATGLLVMGVGRGTRLLRFLGELPKTYEGTGVLGIETTTLDADGEVVRTAAADVRETELRRAMAELVGDIEQVPPAYSAVKVGGQPLHRAARAGRPVEAALRRVRVDAFDLRRFDPPRFGFRVRCSGGTYVRSLVAEVGARVGSGAHLEALRRTRIVPLAVDDAVPPDRP